jgi:hypothetical protein
MCFRWDGVGLCFCKKNVSHKYRVRKAVSGQGGGGGGTKQKAAVPMYPVPCLIAFPLVVDQANVPSTGEQGLCCQVAASTGGGGVATNNFLRNMVNCTWVGR